MLGIEGACGFVVRFHRDEAGSEQVEYLLILAAVVLPMFVAAQLLWAILLFFFGVESLIVDLPLF